MEQLQDNTQPVDSFDDVPAIPPKKNHGGHPYQIYSPSLAKSILREIAANTDLTVSEICKKHGISRQGFYLWLSGLTGMLAPYKRAMAVRSIAQVQAVKEKQRNIAMEADEVSPQDVGNMRKIDLKSRIWSVIDRGAQWRAAKWNPQLFGEHSTVDVNIGLQPGEARRQAFSANQEARRIARDVGADITDVSKAQASDE